MNNFSLMLETARLTMKMSNKAFAITLGFSPKQFSRWKNGKLPNPNNRLYIKK